MNKYFSKTKNKGYAILFTIIVISIISMISFGLADTAFKQMILSGVARDSTTAFYMSDIAVECALYIDNESLINSYTLFPSSYTCAGFDLSITGTLLNYTIKYTSSDNSKCFEADIVKKFINADDIQTTVNARGYNMCDKSNIRTVERAVEVKYGGA